MHKSELSVLIVLLLFAIFTLANPFFLWVPAAVPPVLLVLGIALYSIWERKYGN